MLNRDNDRLTLIADAAFGLRSESELGDLTAAEIKRLSQLRSMVQVYRSRVESPSENVIRRAIDLMPRKLKHLVFSRPSQFNLAGAREAAREHHFLFDQDGVSIRILYLESESGFELMGQISPVKWLVTMGDQAVETSDEGKFSLHVDGLSHPPLTLIGESGSIEVSSAGEIYGSEG